MDQTQLGNRGGHFQSNITYVPIRFLILTIFTKIRVFGKEKNYSKIVKDVLAHIHSEVSTKIVDLSFSVCTN